MVTCKQLSNRVTAYLEGELPFWTRMQIAMHLLMCSSCRRYVKQIGEVAQASGNVPPLEMPDEVAASLADIFTRADDASGDDPPPAAPGT